MNDEQPLVHLPERHDRFEAAVRRRGAYLAATISGGAVGLMLVVVGVRWLGPSALPDMTEASLHEAQQRWLNADPQDYDLDVAVTGRETAVFSVQVRAGIATEARRNGEPLRHQRTWGTWTVPGMFETIARDLETIERNREGSSGSVATDLLLRGEFDADWGLPRRYQRVELRKFGANQEVVWEITRFQTP